MDRFVAYHGVDAPTHQQRFDALAEEGLRPLWLDVSGPAGDARYAAVWVADDGRGWFALHGVDAVSYQQRCDELATQGFVPTLLTATGRHDEAVFAALFENRPVGAWRAQLGLRWGSAHDPDTLPGLAAQAADAGLAPRSLTVYGDPDDPRFAGIWWENREAVDTAWWFADADCYPQIFDAEVAGGLRPASLSVSADARVLAVFRGDKIGPWVARHGLLPADFSNEIDRRAAQQLRPIVVAAGGAGAAARYAAVFAGQERARSRQWRVHDAGPPTGGPRPAGPRPTGTRPTGTWPTGTRPTGSWPTGPRPTGTRPTGSWPTGSWLATLEAEVDAVLAEVMRRNGVRAGALAVARRGELRFSRGCTWAEPGYPVTLPQALFRVAGLSTVFTCAALQALADDGMLDLDVPMFDYLAVTEPLPAGVAVDPWTASVTVREAATRAGGAARGGTFRDAALAAGRAGAPTLDDVVRYVYGRPARDGGGVESAADAVVHVLTAVVQRASGRALDAYVRARLLAPLGLDDLHVGSTAAGSPVPGEVPGYDAPSASPSLLDVSGAWAADAYGGQVLTEVAPGSAGLVTSVTTVARFIGSHAVAGLGGRTVAARHGDLEGTSAGAISRPDGLDVAFAMNHRITDAARVALVGTLGDIIDRHAAKL